MLGGRSPSSMSRPPFRLRLCLRLCMLSVAWCGSSVHKTGCHLYTFIYIIHNAYTPSLFVHVRSLPSLVPISLFFPLHLHAWSSGQSMRGVAEVRRQWMASSQTDAISVHFPLHFTPQTECSYSIIVHCFMVLCNKMLVCSWRSASCGKVETSWCGYCCSSSLEVFRRIRYMPAYIFSSVLITMFSDEPASYGLRCCNVDIYIVYLLTYFLT